MKRFLKTLFVTLLIGAIVCFGFACDNGSNGNNKPKTPGLQIRTYDGEKRIIGYVSATDEKDVVLEIPSDVVEIQSGAFDGNSTIKTIKVGANVKKIAAGAFNGMKALESIELPYIGGSVGAVNEKKTFGYIFGTDSFDEGDAIAQNYNASGSATYYLPKTLKTVVINAGEDYKIPDYAFNGCRYIENVTLNGDVIEIGNNAFEGCRYIEKLVIPSSVTKIGNNAFVDMVGLVGTASTEDTASLQFASTATLVEIGEYAFKGTKLTKVIIPNGVTKIGAFAFSESGVEEVVLTSVVEICEYAFYKCEWLNSVTYNVGLKRVWSNAFNGCKRLEVFALTTTTPTGLAEKGLIELKGVDANNLLVVGANAFANCGNETYEYALSYNNCNFEGGLEASFVNTNFVGMI